MNELLPSSLWCLPQNPLFKEALLSLSFLLHLYTSSSPAWSTQCSLPLSAFTFSLVLCILVFIFLSLVGPYHLNLIPEIISSCPWSPCSTGHIMDSLCPFSWHPHGILALVGTGFLRNYHVPTRSVSLLLEHLLPLTWIAFVYTILFGGAMSPCSSLHPSTSHCTTHFYCSFNVLTI